LAAAVPAICEEPGRELVVAPVVGPATLAVEPGGAKYGADREPVCRKTAFTTTIVLIVTAARIAT
jgi:hypothetical protein